MRTKWLWVPHWYIISIHHRELSSMLSCVIHQDITQKNPLPHVKIPVLNVILSGTRMFPANRVSTQCLMLYKADIWFWVSCFVIRRNLGQILVLLAKSLMLTWICLFHLDIFCYVNCGNVRHVKHARYYLNIQCLCLWFFFFLGSWPLWGCYYSFLLSMFQKLKLNGTQPGYLKC